MRYVAPPAGAWIEIPWELENQAKRWWSLPLRERGLKSDDGGRYCRLRPVAPLAGAWIEIPSDKVIYA